VHSSCGWTVQGSNPGRSRFFALVQIGPWAHPSSCTKVTWSFPGVKPPGRGVDHPPPSSAEVKEKVELNIHSPSGPSWLVVGRNLHFPCNCAIYMNLISTFAQCFYLLIIAPTCLKSLTVDHTQGVSRIVQLMQNICGYFVETNCCIIL